MDAQLDASEILNLFTGQLSTIMYDEIIFFRFFYYFLCTIAVGLCLVTCYV